MGEEKQRTVAPCPDVPEIKALSGAQLDDLIARMLSAAKHGNAVLPSDVRALADQAHSTAAYNALRLTAHTNNKLGLELLAENYKLRDGIKEAIDLLTERTQGSPARSAAHNARVRLEHALSMTAPAAETKEQR